MECGLLPEPLGSWDQVKELLSQILVDHKAGFRAFQEHQDALLELAADGLAITTCALGHFSLRLSLLIFSGPEERWLQLQEELVPWQIASAIEVLQSGWPVFGLLGLLAYKLTRDGRAEKPSCTQPLESFRIRYEEAMLLGKEVPFSRDVETSALRLLPPNEVNRTELGTLSRACLLGAGLPLLGYGASVSCLARREKPLHRRLSNLVQSYEETFLRPAAGRPACLDRRVGQCASAKFQLPNLLVNGIWAAESLHLLQRMSETFAVGNNKLLGALQGGPLPDSMTRKVLVSVDPYEDQHHGHGLPAFTSHLWADSDGFAVIEGLRCPDVMVARDSLPAMPFPGLLVYVDHEAGIGPGRDAGRLTEVLAKYRVVYLGVSEPTAATQCLSRHGSKLQQRARVCAKVFDKANTAPVPSGLSVVYIPFASTSFAGRKHSPLDLASARVQEKKHFLAYMAYACVDHRERLFDLLVRRAFASGLEPPAALSRCTGFQSRGRLQRNHTRNEAASFLDDAVELLRPYRFALVFENKLVPGYVTEKIVNAFLAGCIPIYWGSRAVLEIFNPEAFIYANEIQAPGSRDEELHDPLANLDLVADHVIAVAQDPAAVSRLARAPPLDPSRPAW